MLTHKPIHPLSNAQIAEYTHQSIHAEKKGEFDVKTIVQKIRSNKDSVRAFDIGGDKISTAVFHTENDSIVSEKSTEIIQSPNNEGYLELLETYKAETFPIGISVAGPVKNTSAYGSPKTKNFIHQLSEKYKSDFANLFSTPSVTVENDAVAGLQAGILETVKRFPHIKNVLYLINGSGCNTALLKNNEIYSTESGHVKVADELNPYQQDLPCTMFGNTFVCVENVCAGKAGIASLWEKITHESCSGLQINRKLNEGNLIAENLYDMSAVGQIHTILGLAKIFDLDLSQDTAIVCNGGVFEIELYRERVMQIFEFYIHTPGQFIFTRDFTENACLDGAAIAAIIQ